MSDLPARIEAFLDEFFRFYPLSATAVGMHAFDDRWPDLRPAGRTSRIAFLDRWQSELELAPNFTLAPDERIDRELLVSELEALRFDEVELREGAWDALGYVYMLGGGLFPLLAREFAPLESRLASVAGRLEGIPDLLAAAEAELGSLPDRPASRLHTEMAIRQLPGIAALVDEAVAAAEGASDVPAVAAITPRLAAAAVLAREAIASFGAFLRDDLRPRSSGEGRLGPKLFARKLRHTFRSDISPEQILARARREYDLVRGEMVGIARRIWPEWIPGEPPPNALADGGQEAADERAVRSVLSAIGRQHPSAGNLLERCRASYRGIVDFCRARNLIGVPEDPLEIDWTPPFLREYAGAMLDSPGPLDKGQKAFYFVTPPPGEWTPDQVESYLAEENDRQIELTTIHEGTPGHYLQLVYSNRCPSIVRAVFASGAFIEGWAVYVTQVTIDAGFHADDAALRLVHWKFYLRAITNALVDIGIHAGTMTEKEAMELMVRGGFQEESEAAKKWDRARLTSTQLCTYFVGSSEMWNLERDLRVKAARAAGDAAAAAAIGEPRLLEGFGPTPGFDYRTHLESMIAHGSPPIPLLRRILLDGAGGTS